MRGQIECREDRKHKEITGGTKKGQEAEERTRHINIGQEACNDYDSMKRGQETSRTNRTQ